MKRGTKEYQHHGPSVVDPTVADMERADPSPQEDEDDEHISYALREKRAAADTGLEEKGLGLEK